MNLKKILFFAITFSLFSCENLNKNNAEKNENYAGKITIQCDENLKEIALQLKSVYENIYNEAQINFQFLPEDSIVSNFLNNKTTAVLIARNLSKSENNNATIAQECKITEHIFAFDAIAFITQKNNTDSVISKEIIQQLLLPNTKTKLVFDSKFSGIAKQIVTQNQLSINMLKNAFVVKNTTEVINYIKNANHTIGCIPFNQISDLHNKNVLENLSQIKILSYKTDTNLIALNQHNIAKNLYPYSRKINFILGRNSKKVGGGFASFLYKSKVQKVLFKAGLVPSSLPNRDIIVKEKLF